MVRAKTPEASVLSPWGFERLSRALDCDGMRNILRLEEHQNQLRAVGTHASRRRKMGTKGPQNSSTMQAGTSNADHRNKQDRDASTDNCPDMLDSDENIEHISNCPRPYKLPNPH